MVVRACADQAEAELLFGHEVSCSSPALRPAGQPGENHRVAARAGCYY